MKIVSHPLDKKGVDSSPELWARLRNDYIEKNEVLRKEGFRCVTPSEFYSDLFPPGSLQEPGASHDGMGNAIVIEMDGGTRWRERTSSDGTLVRYEVPVIHRHTLSEGFGGFEELRERSLRDNTFVFCGPLSYWGKARTARNAHQLFAFVVDLDGVGGRQADLLLGHMESPNRYVPRPSYIVNSGTGLHLYYLLDEPVWTRPSLVPGLQEIKRNLVDLCWNGDTSRIETKQYQGIHQGFRMVGTSTKLNGAVGNRKVDEPYEVTAFLVGGDGEEAFRWSLADLATRVARNVGVPGSKEQMAFERKLRAMIGEEEGRVTLAEARERWPGWYERRVVNGEEAGAYTCDKHLYDWYLRILTDHIEIGHRYWGVHFLAAYANKCGVDYETLERDALDLLPVLKLSDQPGNVFTEADLFAALEFYGGGSPNAPARRVRRETVAKSTGLEMLANKRNGRDRKTHVKIMTAIRDIEHPDGSWMNKEGRPKGSPNKHYPKRDAVVAYAREHPDATQREISAATGVSLPTVNKWVRWMREQENRG